MHHAVHITVSGRVQGVMFRDYARRKAQALGIVGTVKNEENGTVAILAEGERNKLDEFIELLKKGSVFSRVEEVSVNDMKPTRNFESFSIVYD